MRTIFALLAACAIGCGSSSHPPAVTNDHPDADSSIPDAGMATILDSSVESHDAAGRTLTTRALYPTDVHNMLLDPFVTADLAWGHFFEFLSTPTTSMNVPLVRTWMSDSPNGMSAPVVRVTALTTSGGADAGAPLVHIPVVLTGSTLDVDAQVWVAVENSDGTPATFATYASSLSVSLVPNSGLPTIPAMTTKYPAPTTPAETVTMNGIQWSRIALSSPVPFVEGGYFVITIANPSITWLLAAPQVTAAPAHPHPRAHEVPLNQADRDAITAYAKYVREHAH